MRIVHLATGLSTGGAEMMLYKLLSHTDLAAYQPAVIALVPGEDSLQGRIEELGVPVHRLGFRKNILTAGRELIKLIRLLRKLKPDVIQGWMYHGNLVASIAGLFLPNRPAVAWNIRHSLDDLAAEGSSALLAIRLSRTLSGMPRSIIYNSRVSQSQHREYGYHPRASLVIPNGFELDQAEGPGEGAAGISSSLGIPPGAVVVGHVARYHPLKDHQNFLQAAGQVLETHPETHFMLIGQDVSLENREIVQWIPRGRESQFHLLGRVEDVPRYLQAMDIFCLSSTSEAWPNAVGEAMAAKLPCVATQVGDTREIIGDTGIIVPPRDPAALAAGLLRVIALGSAERQKWGEAARVRIRDNYGIKEIAGRYYSFYNELAASSQPEAKS